MYMSMYSIHLLYVHLKGAHFLRFKVRGIANSKITKWSNVYIKFTWCEAVDGIDLP